MAGGGRLAGKRRERERQRVAAEGEAAPWVSPPELLAGKRRKNMAKVGREREEEKKKREKLGAGEGERSPEEPPPPFPQGIWYPLIAREEGSS